jgi:acyl carrier protein/GNAT superfamily N-acetyltransferase
MSLRRDLHEFLRSQELLLPADFDDNTALVTSGILDSLALFNLMLWIEERTGRPVDPARLDVRAAWDTVGRIVSFIEEGRVESAPPRDPSARSPSGPRVVRWTPDQEEAIARLQTGLWSPSVELNRAYFRWKYLDNPYGGEPRIYLLLNQAGSPIGMRGFYPSRWRAGSGPVQDILVAEDLLVQDGFRNQGLVTELMEHAVRDLRSHGIRYLFNLSGGPVTVLGSLARGWRSAGYLNPVSRSSLTHTALMALQDRLGGVPVLWRLRGSKALRLPRAERPFATLDRSRGTSQRVDGLSIEISDAPRPDDMAELVLRLHQDGRIRHVRDPVFLDWRYRNPMNVYRFLYASAGSLRGYLALKWARPVWGANPRVQIVDWEADDETCRAALLRVALSRGSFPEIVAWAPEGCAGTSILTREGFRSTRSPGGRRDWPCVLVRSCDSAEPPEDWQLNGVRLLDPRQWDMRMIYSMAG